MRKIKILVVYPNKQPEVKEIRNNIGRLYGIIYYPYKEIELEKNVYLIYSEEAESNGLSLCRKFRNLNIYSNFAIIGKESDELVSLTKSQIGKYYELFSI